MAEKLSMATFWRLFTIGNLNLTKGHPLLQPGGAPTCLASRMLCAGSTPLPGGRSDRCGSWTEEHTCSVQYAFNLFSHNSPMGPNGYNEEEMKMVKETKKIWKTDDVAITATCIRVPIMRAHAESLNLELASDLSESKVSTNLPAHPEFNSQRCQFCFIMNFTLQQSHNFRLEKLG